MTFLRREYIIAYDISNTKVRNKLFERLKDHGLNPIQKSIFWGTLNNAEKRSIERISKEILNEDEEAKLIFVNVDILKNKECFFLGHKLDEFSDKQFGVL